MMRLKEGLFHGWPAWMLGHENLELWIVPAVGGRLMGIQVDGTELCFINPLLAGRLPSEEPAIWRGLCGDWTFPLWGGGKTWVAPEEAWPGGNPHRDLDSGGYQVLKAWCDPKSGGLELQSPVCRETGLQIRRRVSLRADSGSWTVEHTLSNAGAFPRRCGIWDVLMLRRPCQVVFELADIPMGRGFDHFREIPGKGEVDDLRRQGILDADGGRLRVQCRRAQQYKLGIAGASGAIEAQLELPEGRFRYWRTAPVPAGAVHAHGHPAEVFNAPDLPYFEVESHSPLANLQPGGSIAYTVCEGAQKR
jgi:hypothetical protein